MEESYLLETLISYYKKLRLTKPSEEERFYVLNIELRLAEALIKDFGEENALKVANVIKAMSDE